MNLKFLDNEKQINSKTYLKIALIVGTVLLSLFIFILTLPRGIRVEIRQNKSLSESPIVKTISTSKKNKPLGDVLLENDLPLDSSYSYSADLNTPISEVGSLVISKKVNATINENGTPKAILSSASTIEELLQEVGIQTYNTDEIEPSVETPLTEETANVTVNHTTYIDEQGVVMIGSALDLSPNVPAPVQEGITDGVDFVNGVYVNGTPQVINTAGIPNATRTATGAYDTLSVDSYARLVDSGHPLPGDYEPADLVYMNYGSQRMRAEAANAFNLMNTAIASELGVELLPISCYRSAYEQSGISSSLAAGAGYSEHQTGLTVDLGIAGYTAIDNSDHFETTEAYAWLRNNAQKFGFILSMPENTYWVGFEPWHWRFVGVDLATEIWTAQMNGTAIQMGDYLS